MDMKEAEKPADPLRSFRPRNRRRILCVSPKYTNSFGTFNHAFPLMGNVKAFMPPQGILLVAAMVPPGWEVQFVDENIRKARDEEFAWADAVFAWLGKELDPKGARPWALRADGPTPTP